MAGLRDLEAGKIYIGPVEPEKEDQSDETKNGDKPFNGTLAVTGPAFIGSHSKKARGVLNVGTDLGDFSPSVGGRAVDIEGDVAIDGKTVQTGSAFINDNVTITGSANVSGKVTCGSLSSGAPKSFDIPHPNIKGYRLKHACLEGPEAAIYVRGRVSVDGIIELPDYWQNFIDKESITVHLTPNGAHQELFVEKIEYGKRVYVKNQAGGKIDAYYQVWANRGDVSFQVEYADHNIKEDGTWFTSDT